MTSSAVVWLVGDQKRQVARQGHGDNDPLAHAAGELVRVVACPARRDAHVLDELPHPTAGFASGDALMKQDCLDDLVADPPHRVERVHCPWKTIDISAQRSALKRPGFAPTTHVSKNRIGPSTAALGVGGQNRPARACSCRTLTPPQARPFDPDAVSGIGDTHVALHRPAAATSVHTIIDRK